MLTRRHFIKALAALAGSTLVSACGRRIPTSPAPTLIPSATLPPTVTPSPLPTSTRTPTPVPSATPTVTPTLVPTPTPPELVTIRGGQFIYRGSRLPIQGFNYYPKMHPWRAFNVGEWEPRVTERELRLGVGLGANTVRIVIDYPFSLPSNREIRPGEYSFGPLPEYVRNIKEFLDIAERLGLLVIVTLFDSMDWTLYQPGYRWIAEEYLKELIPSFVDDPRILCWDLQNEPDRAIVLVSNNAVIPFFQRISTLIRQMDPRHLQTIGWIDRARARYFPDLDPYLDFWCFHFYDKASNLADLVRFYNGKTTKPVLLEEFGLPSGGPGYTGPNAESDQAEHYRSVLTTLQQNGACGSVLWILLDFPIGLAGNPPLQTDSPENHFGIFRLDYTDKPAAPVLRSFWRPSV